MKVEDQINEAREIFLNIEKLVDSGQIHITNPDLLRALAFATAVIELVFAYVSSQSNHKG